MPKSKDATRRAHTRFSCDLSIQIYSPVSQTLIAEAQLIDLGMGGGNISTEFNLQRSVLYEFRFQWNKERLALLGQVVWSAPTDLKGPKANRYGISFNLTAAQEGLLRSLLDNVAAR